MNEKVSIIIPIYNSEKYLKQCIDSILEQTYQNIEIVLVDDGSKDNSFNIMQDYGNKDVRIKILSRENKGQFQTRKDGLEIATGEYVTFVDADDWLDIHTIENMVKIQNQYNADIVRCSYIDEHIEENRKVPNLPAYPEITYIKKEEFIEKVYPIFVTTHQINSIWGQMIRKSQIGEYQSNPEIRIAEDLMFNLQLYQDVDSVVFIPDTYYHYRTNIEGITNIKDIDATKRKIQNVIQVYSLYYELIRKWNMDNAMNQKLVSERILREVIKCIETAYTFKSSFQEKIEICQYGQNLLKTITKIQENVNDLTIIDKFLLKGKHRRLVVYKFFQFKLIYELKKMVKQLLIIQNRKREKK